MAKSMELYSDSELFYQLKSDKRTSERAFVELYNRLPPRIYAYCRRFLSDREEARDIFQETFVRFYQSANKERDMTNVPAFILRIARNLCVNSKRHEKPAISYEDYMIVNHDNRDDKDELLNLIKMALELLPNDLRESFILREYEGLTYSEIAELTGSSLPTVKVRIFRAKQKIREILSPYLADLSKY